MNLYDEGKGGEEEMGGQCERKGRRAEETEEKGCQEKRG